MIATAIDSAVASIRMFANSISLSDPIFERKAIPAI